MIFTNGVEYYNVKKLYTKNVILYAIFFEKKQDIVKK